MDFDKIWTWQSPLSPLERQVIERAGTELPFSGRYLQNTTAGSYVCRRCGTPLFRTEHQFPSHCGWPSFDDEIPGAVQRRTDPDGRRTEILCAHCKGHLGHVFEGEGMTVRNLRHCVNSVSMRFVPAPEASIEHALVAAGCFWGVESQLARLPGILDTAVGYAGGHKKNPTYDDVCGGDTGHLESVLVRFDSARLSYEELLKAFFEIHDFEQENGQGPDIGSQYLSAVFALSPAQEETARRLIGELAERGYRVATRVLPPAEFWRAEDGHQNYYALRQAKPYCHVRRKIFQNSPHTAAR